MNSLQVIDMFFRACYEFLFKVWDVLKTGESEVRARRQAIPQDSEKTKVEKRNIIDKRQCHIGKFRDLHGFLKDEEGSRAGFPDHGSYNAAAEADLHPGDIIHIMDKVPDADPDKPPHHQRVMLFLWEQSPSAMACIPFCRRDDYRSPRNGKSWRVLQDHEYPQQDAEPRRPTLPTTRQRYADPAISLCLPAKLNPGYSLETGIHIPLTEHWRVEYDQLMVCKIGWLPESSCKTVTEEIKLAVDGWLRTLSPEDEPVEVVESADESPNVEGNKKHLHHEKDKPQRKSSKSKPSHNARDFIGGVRLNVR